MIPNNAAQAISAIKDGVLGLITLAKIGDITLGALTSLENPSFLRITKKKVENGSNVNDMAVDDDPPLTLGVLLTNPQFSAEAGATAIVTGDPGIFTDTWRDKREALYQYKDDREIITVQTHENVYTSRIIQSIDPVWSIEENFDAFFATVSFEKYQTFETLTGGAGGLIDAAKESVGGL
jgi:hypothetical protein